MFVRVRGSFHEWQAIYDAALNIWGTWTALAGKPNGNFQIGEGGRQNSDQRPTVQTVALVNVRRYTPGLLKRQQKANHAGVAITGATTFQ